MGGKAFLNVLQGVAFPRMKTATYHALKAKRTEDLKQFFRLVGVPREAPEKDSHGDLDFVVCDPIKDSPNPEDLRTLLGATCYLAAGPVINFAIPLDPSQSAGDFYQMDMTRCVDEKEWERFLYFQSYGDLGMILGLLARANGLSLGLHGLKVPKSDENNIDPYLLSDSLPEIFRFLGLDINAWEKGFSSLHAIFQWTASSRWFNAYLIRESSRRQHRRIDRKMYQQFLEWVEEQRAVAGHSTITSASDSLIGPADAVEAAKEFFGKKEEYETLIERDRRRKKRKGDFNGHLVMEWTGLHGRDVKLLMDEVRKVLDTEALETLSKEEIQSLVLEIQERMAVLGATEPT
ncbi:hypothetical protein M422DRAFT_241038 [Sphaerobolus stellatus SS14]|nr:hypothetical protein M422DRAFT_241038 [Sphaerobolus stellatus SS14]